MLGQDWNSAGVLIKCFGMCEADSDLVNYLTVVFFSSVWVGDDY